VEEAFIHRNYFGGILCGPRVPVHIQLQEYKIILEEVILEEI